MTRQAYVLVALVLTCLALLSSAVWWNGGSAKDYQQDLEYYSRKCESERQSKEGEYKKDCQRILYRTLDDPIALLTGGLTIATAALFVVTYLLYAAAARQGADAQKAVAAAESSATAAKIQSEVALGTLRLAQADQRAWLIVRTESQNARDWYISPTGFEWRFYFANMGSRAALIHKVEAFASIADEMPPIDAGAPGARVQSQPGRFYPDPVRSDFDITAEVIESLGKSEAFTARGERNGPGWDNLPAEIAQERQHLRLMVSAPEGVEGKVWFWLVGSVTYTDITSDELRVTQFGLRFGLPFPKIKPIEEEGYNYRT